MLEPSFPSQLFLQINDTSRDVVGADDKLWLDLGELHVSDPEQWEWLTASCMSLNEMQVGGELVQYLGDVQLIHLYNC
jgi:hypothetical protein